MAMTYTQMIEAALESQPGKWVSRSQIKTYMAKNFGYLDNATSKNHLKKALVKFERKGDSYKVSKALKAQKVAATKAAANKEKVAAKKAAMTSEMGPLEENEPLALPQLSLA